MLRIHVTILDRATEIHTIALAFRPSDGRWSRILRRNGFSSDRWTVALLKPDLCGANWKPREWGDRTYRTAHQWLLDNLPLIALGLDDDEIESIEINVESILD